jgi:hypothetical protein
MYVRPIWSGVIFVAGLVTLILAIALGDTEWIIAGAAFVIFGAGRLLRWRRFSRIARR